MPSGERLINVTRAQAGLFSTVACIHAVIREFIWICKSDAEYPCIVHPPSGNLVLVSPINASQPLDVDHLLQNAVKAMSNRNVTPTTPHGRKGRRWA
jgi:hypothetical protein